MPKGSGTGIAAVDGVGSHAFTEHVGEVRFELEGSTLSELFSEAARAFAELVTRETVAGTGASRRIVVHGRDAESLLVAFLDDLVFRAEIEHRVYPDARVIRFDERELEVSLRAAPTVIPRVPVKAATFHDLAVRRTPEGFAASIVLDV